jgi:hypothetical protein
VSKQKAFGRDSASGERTALIPFVTSIVGPAPAQRHAVRKKTTRIMGETGFPSGLPFQFLKQKGHLPNAHYVAPPAAVVTYRVFRSLPPKAQFVTFFTGISMMRSMFPFGATRTIHAPLKRQFQR